MAKTLLKACSPVDPFDSTGRPPQRDEEHADSECFSAHCSWTPRAEGAGAIVRAGGTRFRLDLQGWDNREDELWNWRHSGRQRTSRRRRGDVSRKGPPGSPPPPPRGSRGRRRAGHRAHCGRRRPLPAGQLYSGRRPTFTGPIRVSRRRSALFARPAPHRPSRCGHGGAAADGGPFAARAVPPRRGRHNAGRRGGRRAQWSRRS